MLELRDKAQKLAARRPRRARAAAGSHAEGGPALRARQPRLLARPRRSRASSARCAKPAGARFEDLLRRALRILSAR